MEEELPEDVSLSSSSVEGIRWRDEVLQVMYWMHGEGFGKEVTVEEIQRFLDVDRSVLIGSLQHLVVTGCLKAVSADTFQLTRAGLQEGKRRFLDEFEPLLKHGHGECNDPDCECHLAESPEDTCWASKDEGPTHQPNK